MASPQADVRVNLEVNAAREAYAVWAYRAGSEIAWEHLPQQIQTAWREVVCYLIAEPDCCECGEEMVCVTCDAEIIYECPRCAAGLTCTECDKPVSAILRRINGEE